MSSLQNNPAYQDIVQSYTNSREKAAFAASDTAAILRDDGIDPDIAWEIDAQVGPPGPVITDDHLLANTGQGDWKPESGEPPPVGYTFYNAANELYQWIEKKGKHAPPPRDYQAENTEAFKALDQVQAVANPNLAEQKQAVSEFKDAEVDPAAIQKKAELTEKDIAEYGLGASGWLNFGFTKLGMEYMGLRDAPDDVKLAVLAMYAITNSPDWYRDNPMGMNWNGTWRLGKEIISDPISYLGLAQVRGLLTAGSTLAGKMGVKNPFMQRLAGGLFGKGAISGEGGALTMFQNMLVQKARGAKEIDWDEAKQAAIYGAGGTLALTTTLPIAAHGAKKAWQAIVDTAGQAAREGGATSRMFVGPQSKTADKRKLEIAKEMEKVGHDREEIRKSTGWFSDKKGKWMSEVSDELAQTRFDQFDVDTLTKAGIDVISDMRIMEGDPRYIGRWFHSLGLRGPRQAGAFTLEDLKQLPALADKPEVLAAAEKVDAALKGGTLGDVFSSPEVMKAYPWLAEVPFYMDTEKLGAAVSGKVKPDLRKKGGGYTMNLGRIKDESIKSVLSHEAQHIIQNYEKWSRGGSPDEFKLSKADEEEIFETLTASIAAARWIEHKEANPQMAAGPLWDMFVAIYKANMNGLEPPSAVQSLSSKHYNTFKETEQWQREILKHSKSEGSQFEAYEKLAGEAQARLTQSRMGLTAEQRAARDPLEEMTTSSGEKLTEDDLLYVNPEQHAYNPDVYSSVPRPSQIDMRIRQGAFENDVRAGEITPENAKSLGHDPDEVRAILADQQKEFVARSQKGPSEPIQHVVANEANNPNSLLNMVYNAVGDPPPAPKGGWTKAHLAQLLDKQARESGRRITVFDDKAANQISDTITDEAVAALSRKGNASGWYNKQIKDTIKILNKIHPELKAGSTNEGMFKLGLAITSNGKTVDYNFKAGEYLYQHFQKNGRFPNDVKGLEAAVGGFGQEVNTLVLSMQKANRLIDKMGTDDFVKFLNTEFTVRELKAAGFTVSREAQDYNTHGSAIFGPKIGGGFYQNLRGNFEPITFDRWWTASWGRWTGNSVFQLTKKGKQDQFDKFKQLYGEELAAAGKKLPKTDRAIVDAAKRMFKVYNRNNFQPRTPLNQAAQRLAEGRKTKMKEEPGSSGNRNFMRQAAKQALEKMRAMGHNVTPADLQATVWYPEKELHRRFNIGTSRSDPDDYAAAAQRFYDEMKKEGKIGRGKRKP